MEHLDVPVNEEARVERIGERLSWITLAASAIFGIVDALFVGVFSPQMLSNPIFWDSSLILLVAWGIAWVGFNIFALALTLIPYRRGERWAWYTLWMLPLLWLSLFALWPDFRLYLVFAILTAAGLILPYRRFFSRRDEEESSV
jgi:hypothetical protein